MPRLNAEPGFHQFPLDDPGPVAASGIAGRAAGRGVSWVRSFVSSHRRRRLSGAGRPQRHAPPADRNSEAFVVDTYSYR
ncbi:MAG: hypothetical protein JWQ89_2898 [Devosia sp.]|nr:hypothetical protein [Devosia sp.]